MSSLLHCRGSVKLRMVHELVFWLLVFCIPIFLVTTALRWAVNEVKLYEYGFSKYSVDQATGISNTELKKVAVQLIDYFNFRVNEAQVIVGEGEERVALFSQKEIIHLSDVRGLIWLNNFVQMLTLVLMAICISVLALLSKQRWLVLAKGAFVGSGLTLGLAMALALWCLIGFDQFFYLFHIASFRNEYWMLNPAEDYLIRLFPEGFFYDAALFVFSAILVVSLIVMAGSFCALRFLGGRAGVRSAWGGSAA